MTAIELINKLSFFPKDMEVKIHFQHHTGIDGIGGEYCDFYEGNIYFVELDNNKVSILGED